MNGDAICRKLESLAAQGVGLPALREAAVRLLHEACERFHWTGIYDLFPDDTLRLGPFLGAPTDHVFIGYGQGVCGTAVAEGRNLNIPDVSRLSNYLACSTETRSELVVLIRSGERIHGQIDIDSHDLAAFDESIEAEVQKVADLLARFHDRSANDRAA
jgi:GAF domain-containing protein